MDDSREARAIDMVEQLKESATNCGLLMRQGIAVMRAPIRPTLIRQPPLTKPTWKMRFH
jgi:hypothetical protein